MSAQLTELVPVLHELKRSEKLFVIQYLASELAQEESTLLEPGMEYQVWSPYDADEAAQIMLQVLAETKAGPLAKSQQFSFISIATGHIPAIPRPYVPLSLQHQAQTIDVTGLVDTGADINVLPYPVGLKLGAIWEQQRAVIKLTGNLAQFEARVLVVTATIGELSPVQLVFAWTRSETVPLILGQVNFFQEFNVCFYRSLLVFDVSPK